MRIINGKWQDTNGDPVNNFSYNQVQEIGDNLVNLYGNNITYSRIELVSALKTLTPRQESDLAFILSDARGISKLSGY